MAMVDIGEKPLTERKAVVRGLLRLKPATIEVIKSNRVKKGDVLSVSEVCAIQAAKGTSQLLPLCHQIPLTCVDVSFSLLDDGVVCTCTVSAYYRTGVEMEALCGVSTGLLNVWDMVKYLEKDEKGQYPDTRIEDIRVLSKQKVER
ncbi:MAG: cyclic pyranopterin monophosphate synthase MoaC [Methermicoccaceae archaeon]